MTEIMNKVALDNRSTTICLGRLIITDKVNYYLAIGMEKISIDSTDYYALSTNSPIGSQLLGKRLGNNIPFNNAKILKII